MIIVAHNLLKAPSKKKSDPLNPPFEVINFVLRFSKIAY